MSRKFISLVLAASVAIAGVGATATPAKAGNDDLAKLLVGATALVIIGTAIKESNQGNVVVHQYHKPAPKPHYSHKKTYHKPYYTPKKTYKAKKTIHAKPIYRPTVPAGCKTVVNTLNGPVKGYGARCLHNNMRGARNLPSQCSYQVRQVRGAHPRTLYDAYCLGRHGYNVASR